MPNATQPSQKSGDSRRRKSRGGNNRNRNNNNNRGARGPKSNRSGGPRPKRGPRKVELTFWQKILKAIGLYKEPTRSSGRKSKDSPKPKSNTRNARSGESKPKQNNNRKARSRGGDPSTVESARVYFGNLSYDVTEQDLEELIKGVGPVRSAEIVYNRNTHRSKGYGFVEMLHQDDAVRCVEVLNDQPFMGRNMIVSGAKSKGTDSREEQDEQETTPTKVEDIELAPLPKENPSFFEEEDEPKIETVVKEPASAETAPTEQDDTEKKSSDA